MTNLHKELLEMYKKIKVELKKNKVRHFAIGGTAIGALREKGFIPWDDDMDFAIFEEDIELFKKSICDSGYVLETPERKTLQYFFKVYDPKIKIGTESDDGLLFIDFMIAQKKRKWGLGRRFMFRFWDLMAVAKRKPFKYIKGEEGIFVAVGYKIFESIFFLVTKKRLGKRMIKTVINAPLVKKADDNIRWLYHWNKDEYYNTRNIDDLPFEKTTVPVNRTFANDVKHIHGEVMKRPPEADRFNHSIVIKEKSN